MSDAKLTPLEIPTKLADNPSSGPKLAVEVKKKNSDMIQAADPKATRALVALMNQHAVIGGAAAHWGGPAAFAEIMSATHALMFEKKSWHQAFNFINDAGHTENGVYALRANYGFDDLSFEDLKGFRSIDSKLTGHGEAHLNPEGVLISNGPLGSGLPQAQGLAMADKLLKNDRVTVCTISDGASMEGEAKESFAAIPGLAHKGKINPFLLLISDNNTKLSGRIDHDSFSMRPTFNSLESLGWDVREVKNGHDLQDVFSAIEDGINAVSKNCLKPIAIVFQTIKGYGVKMTEDMPSGGHGYPLKPYDERLPEFINEIFGGNAPSEFMDWAKSIVASKPAPGESSGVKKEKVQPGFARAAINAVKNGSPLFSLSTDLQGSTGIADFQKECSDHFIDLGVAESNMVSTAIGLSKAGFIPIVDTFAQFGISKGNLPMIMAGLSQGPMIALFSHTGFQDAADGASHQATTYMSALANIPHVKTIICSCSEEAEKYMSAAIKEFEDIRKAGKTPDSIVFFFGRENFPLTYGEKKYEWLKPQLLQEGKDGLIVASGSMVDKAIEAAKVLKSKGKEATVINHPFVNRVDTKFFTDLLEKNSGKIITIEDHQIQGGMGSYLAHAISQTGTPFKMKSLGITGEFGQSAYQADQLYKKHNMDSESIVANFLEL